MNRRNFLTWSAGAAAGLLLGKEVKAVPRQKKPSSSFGWIAITFDDGYHSVYEAATNIMGADIPGTAFLVPDWIGSR